MVGSSSYQMFSETPAPQAPESDTRHRGARWVMCIRIVGMVGFEPTISSPRTRRDSRFRYIPRFSALTSLAGRNRAGWI